MNQHYSIVGHWGKPFNDKELELWVKDLRSKLKHPEVSLGIVLVSMNYLPYLNNILDIVRIYGQTPILIGSSSVSIIHNEYELENHSGITLQLYYLPGSKLNTYVLNPDDVFDNNDPYFWQKKTNVGLSDTKGWLCFANPIELDAELLVKQWNRNYPGIPLIGGLNIDNTMTSPVLILNGESYERGVIMLSVGGKVALKAHVAQGARSIGTPMKITKVNGPFVHELDGKPASDIFQKIIEHLYDSSDIFSMKNFFVGLSVDGYDPQRKDNKFLIRTILGLDPFSGILAIDANPKLGQMLQFQVRDPKNAALNLTDMLMRLKTEAKDREIYGGFMITCNARGKSFFGSSNHDSMMIQDNFKNLPVSGYFCSGEIGPVGTNNFINTYSVSLGLFVSDNES